MGQHRLVRAWGASLALALAVGGFGAVPAAFADDASAGGGSGSNSLINWTALSGSTGTSSISLAYSDRINDAERLVDGGSVVVGCLDGNKVEGIEGAKGKQDALIACYDTDGALVWETLAGGSDTDYFNAVTTMPDGGFVAVGRTKSDDGDVAGLAEGNNDGLIAKFSADGTLEKAVVFGGSDKDELYDVTSAQDGGFVVVGQCFSEDGDLADIGTAGKGDAVIAKFDAELNVVWVGRVAGSAADYFGSVVANPDGGFVAAGYTSSSDGDMAEAGTQGGKDGLAAKFSADGEREWIRVFGGSEDDELASVARAHLKGVDMSDEEGGERPDVDPSEIDGGYILSGTTASADGVFAGAKDSGAGVDSGYLLKIDANGSLEWSKVLENENSATADSVMATANGFTVAGTYEGSSLDFTGQDSYGKDDLYVASFSKEGRYLGMNTVGGADNDRLGGITFGGSGDYLLYGATASSDGPFTGMQGKTDGFLMSLNAEVADTHAEEKYLVPVVAWHASKDQPSMMADMLYKDAYVEKTGEQYRITFYFINANIMGVQVNASTLGAVSYDFDGQTLEADVDEYDPVTQVKTCTITTDTLDENVMIHIEDAMGDIRLHFDPQGMQEAETPPYFEPVEVTLPDFESAWKTGVGGSSTDYPNAATVLADGTLVVGGQAYSNDGDFAERPNTASSAFLSAYDQSGALRATTFLSCEEYYTSAYVASLSAAPDGGFFAGGSYTLDELTSLIPSGDFASLAEEGGAYGGNDGYVARYDAEMNLVWLAGFSGSEHDQVKEVQATDDGGCVAVIETLSTDGDMAGENEGLYDLLVVKYNASGEVAWTRDIGGRNLESTDRGVDVLENGNIVVAGITSSGSGDFVGTDYFGDIFDLFAAELDGSTGEIRWLKTYGGDKSDYLASVTATSDGGFVMTGNTSSSTGTFGGANPSAYDNAYVVKCDASGAVEWTSCIKSSDASEAKRVVELADGYAVLGDSRGTDFDFQDKGKGSMDAFVALFDKQGDRISLENIGGTLADYSADLAVLNDHQLAVLSYGQSLDGDYAAVGNDESGNYSGLLLAFDYQEEPVDSTALQGLVDEVAALSPADYTSETWEVLEAKLEAARALLGNADASQEQIDACYVELLAAYEGLSPVQEIDMEGLRAFVGKVSGLDASGYTEASWAAFSSALAEAQALLANGASSQDEADAALAKLEEAYAALERAAGSVDATGLKELVDAVEGLSPSDYTEGSWADVQEALAAARAVLDDPRATQDEVDEALEALQEAYDGLVRTSGDGANGDAGADADRGGETALVRTGDASGTLAAAAAAAAAAGLLAATGAMRARCRSDRR